MQENDRVALEEMMKEFNEFGKLSQDEFHSRSTPQAKMKYYKIIYDIASHGTKVEKEIILMSFQSILTTYLLQHAIVDLGSDEKNADWIYAVWQRYDTFLSWCLFAFSYASRVYRKDLRETGMTIFRERIMRESAPIVFRYLLKLLHSDRLGESVDKQKLKGLLTLALADQLEDSFCSKFFFEAYVLQAKEDFTKLVEQWHRKHSHIADFFERIEDALAAEEIRSTTCFSLDGGKKVMQDVEKTIQDSEIAQQRLLFSEDGLLDFFIHEKYNVLRKLFKMLFSCDKKVFPRAFEEVVNTCGNRATVFLHNEHRDFAREILILRNRCEKITKMCFDNSKTMQSAVRRSFVNILSKKYPVVSHDGEKHSVNFWECLISHIDYNLRYAGTAELLDRESLSILGYLHNNISLCKTLGKNILSRMLFPEDVFHLDKEKCFSKTISEWVDLKPLADDLIKDYELSQNFMKINQKECPVDVSLLFLRSSSWIKKEVYNSEEAEASTVFPTVVEKRLSQLLEAYSVERRTITLCRNMGSATLKAKLNRKEFTLRTSILQAILLLAFNSCDKLLIKSFCDDKNIGSTLLFREISPLLDAKLIFLDGDQENESLSVDSYIVLNTSFTSEVNTIRIERHKNRVTLDQDIQLSSSFHQNYLEASILKHLKSVENASVGDVVQFCMKNSLDVSSRRLIKSSIEALIRRGIIARKSNGDLTYVA